MATLITWCALVLVVGQPGPAAAARVPAAAAAACVRGPAVWAAPLPAGVKSLVADFGADPTGKTDATTALQTALTAARVENVTVFVPLGCYAVTRTLMAVQPRNGRWQPTVIVGEVIMMICPPRPAPFGGQSWLARGPWLIAPQCTPTCLSTFVGPMRPCPHFKLGAGGTGGRWGDSPAHLHTSTRCLLAVRRAAPAPSPALTVDTPPAAAPTAALNDPLAL